MSKAHPEAGNNGNVPPPEHRWKPGQSGNPAGRPNAGASVREHFNQMTNWTLDQLMGVVNDSKAPADKVTAARDWIAAMAPPDVADFEEALDNGMTLKQLRAEGVATDRIKKYARRVSRDGTVSHTIELRDDRNSCLERVLDRTDGKPRQGIDMTHQSGNGLGIIVRIEDGPAPVLPPPPVCEVGGDKPNALPDE